MKHDFPILKVKMITPDGNQTYLKTLPQVESKMVGNGSGVDLNWGIDLEVAEEVVSIATEVIDYVNGVTVPRDFTFQIVDECITGELPDMVYYNYSHTKGAFIQA